MTKRIDVYISTLKRLTRTETDTALASALGVAKQTISSWRRRETVPWRLQYELIDKYGPEAAFNNEINYVATQREKQVILHVFLALYDIHKDRFDPSKDPRRYNDWAQAFLNFEYQLERLIREAGFVGEENGLFDRVAIADAILKKIESGELEDATHSFDVFLHDSEGPQ
ncbi:hypothetical protein GCM10011491_07270 [Brucella endophytica]|uniref:Bacteriophage CI repressor N-terminal domain-containing protein n=2 Tax=Brucella endophytica TaxID=1963359 RepID=A0A916S5T7_9HYPH|nr:hypothetical protein GCM10011491_07270 [Brucella endophytica]